MSVSTISTPVQTPTLDLSFVADLWWALVAGVKTRTAPASIDRRLFEICVVVQVANDLKSGDLCIPESDKFRDYRTQLLSWEDVHPRLSNYGEQAGVAIEPKAFIAQLRNQLEERSRLTDNSFPENRHLRFENGEPILTPVEAVPDPEGLDFRLSHQLRSVWSRSRFLTRSPTRNIGSTGRITSARSRASRRSSSELVTGTC